MHECQSKENTKALCVDILNLMKNYQSKICLKCFSISNISLIIAELIKNEFTKKEIKELIETCYKEVFKWQNNQ